MFQTFFLPNPKNEQNPDHIFENIDFGSFFSCRSSLVLIFDGTTLLSIISFY